MQAKPGGERPSHPSQHTRNDVPIRLRAYQPGDEEFVLGLAPRLLTGIAPWRSTESWLEAVKGWLAQDFETHGKQSMLFIAEDEKGERLGFAGVAHAQHFTGEKHAYLGELAVREAAEGRGVGQALVRACEQWARQQGYRCLTLDTGPHYNERARRF